MPHKHLEPESQRKLFLVVFQTRQRQPSEEWNDFGDELHLLADIAFPEFNDKAKELLLLECYLCELYTPKLLLLLETAEDAG